MLKAATQVVTCTGPGCPTGGLTLGQLQTSGLILGSLAKDEKLVLSYSCSIN